MTKALRSKKIIFLLPLIVFIVYLLTSKGETPYNYFTRLADAFLHGRVYLTQNPPWLSELVPGEGGIYYVVQPPMPALLAMPFVLLFGTDFQQQILAHIVGALIVAVSISLAMKFTKKNSVIYWFVLLSAIGTIMWFEAVSGSVWYLGQITAALFLLLAINESLGKKRLFLVGLFISAAYLARIHTILSIFFFIYLLRDKLLFNFKNMILFGLGLSVFAGFNAFYNLARWEVPWDKGYFLIPGILNEPWFNKGMLNVAYIPEHLRLLFLSLPKRIDNFPYIIPSWYGLSIVLTTPAFFFSLKNKIKEHDVKFAWLSIFLIFLILSLRGGTGWTQFGYRYAVDFYPFLLYLTIKRISKTSLSKLHWLLLLFGVLVNFWGVVWINKFDWVAF